MGNRGLPSPSGGQIRRCCRLPRYSDRGLLGTCSQGLDKPFGGLGFQGFDIGIGPLLFVMPAKAGQNQNADARDAPFALNGFPPSAGTDENVVCVNDSERIGDG